MDTTPHSSTKIEWQHGGDGSDDGDGGNGDDGGKRESNAEMSRGGDAAAHGETGSRLVRPLSYWTDELADLEILSGEQQSGVSGARHATILDCECGALRGGAIRPLPSSHGPRMSKLHEVRRAAA